MGDVRGDVRLRPECAMASTAPRMATVVCRVDNAMRQGFRRSGASGFCWT